MRFAVLCGLGVLLAVPTAQSREKPLRGPQRCADFEVNLLRQFQPIPGDANYKAPKADGTVVELLDEGVEDIFPVLVNDGGGEAGTIAREDRDVFTGVEAVRVTPMQKYRSMIPGWKYKIVEKPQNAGEFRYLRFAWKKTGGTGIMIQFHDTVKSWGFRYHAGRNVFGWDPSLQVSASIPKDWVVVTRDLFKDFGAFTISGFALSPLDGTQGLFDHMLLGRTIEDLDKATDAAQGRVKPAKALEAKERGALWADLMGTDRVKAAAAQRVFLATATDHDAFIEKQLATLVVDRDTTDKVRQLIAQLDDDSFQVRENATDGLIQLGAPAVEAVRVLATSGPSDEVRYRAKFIQRRIGGDAPVSAAGRTVRVVRVLERSATPDARKLLAKISSGELGFDLATDAKAALARLPQLP